MLLSQLGDDEVRVAVHGSALGAHPGAEVAGVVQEAGRAAAELLGRPVLVPRLLPCGECGLCQRGRVASCPHRRRRGAPAALEQVPARFLLPLDPPLLAHAVAPSDLWRHAALCDALAAPYSALVRAGQSPGELCVVLGGGFRAAAAVLVVRALGCQAVVLAADADERERLCAPPFSARKALDSLGLDPEAGRAAVREIAAEASLPAHGLCLLETTGTDAGRLRALGMLEAGGSALLLDRMQPLAPLPEGDELPAPLPAGPGLCGPAALDRLSREQCQVIGVGAAHPDLLPELAALVQRAEIDLSALVAAVTPAEIDAVLGRRRRGEGDRLKLPIVRFHE